MLTVPEAAKRAGLVPETIRRWIRAGRLPATKVGTQHLIREQDLAAAIRRERPRGRPMRASEAAEAYTAAAKPRRLLDRITVDSNVLVGKPIVRGTRLSVELILDFLAGGWTEQDLLDNYPHISREDILACIAFASERIKAERIYPLPAGP